MPSRVIMDDIDYGKIVVAVIGMVGAVVVAIIGKLKFDVKKAEKYVEKEFQIQRDALNFGRYLREWTFIQQELIALCDETCIDRFMIFIAVNGIHDSRTTSAVYEYHSGESKPYQYIRFPIDDDYRDRLREMIKQGSISFKTKDIDSSLIKNVYMAEGVDESAWFHLETRVIGSEGAKAIAYASFATHSKDDSIGINGEVHTRCLVLISKIKGFVDDFDNPNGG